MKKTVNSDGLTFEEFTAIRNAEKRKTERPTLGTNEKGQLVNSDGLTFEEFSRLKTYESGVKTDRIKLPSLKQDRSSLRKSYDEIEITYDPTIRSPQSNKPKEDPGLPSVVSKKKTDKNIAEDAILSGGYKSLDDSDPLALINKEFGEKLSSAEEAINQRTELMSISGKRIEGSVKKLSELENLVFAYDSRLKHLDAEYKKNPTAEIAEEFNRFIDDRAKAVQDYDKLLQQLKGYEKTHWSLGGDVSALAYKYEKIYGDYESAHKDFVASLRDPNTL
ncbi:MAG: hypothetical protein IJ303_02690, partial [Clostridia bacterium]|nr:hypothetical protein [Clostridia bacterium]